MKIYKIFFLLILCVLLSCSKKEEKRSNKKIVVSIPTYEFFVKKLTRGFEVEIYCLIGENQNPHFFEPTIKDLSKIKKAIVWFTIGENFEKKLISFIENEKNLEQLKIIDLQKNINNLLKNSCKCSHGTLFDNHTWLNPKLAIVQIKTIYEELIKIFPQYQEELNENYKNLICKLTKLNSNIKEKLKNSNISAFVTSHGAFSYFCKEYNLKQITIEFEGKEPTSKHLEKILKKAKKHKIDKIFIQRQYNNKGAQLLANKLNKPLYIIDPYSIDYEYTINRFVNILIK